MCKKLCFLIAFVLVLGLVGSARADEPPAPWAHSDIGAPEVAGSADYNPADGSIAVTGDGYDIWDDHDDFHYVYRQWSGDCDLIARCVSLTGNGGDWRRAGWMIRQDLTTGSKMCIMMIVGNAADGCAFEGRTVADQGPGDPMFSTGADALPDVDPVTTPEWIRLVKTGSDTFDTYISENGVDWTYFTSNSASTSGPLTITDPFYVGLAITSCTATTTDTAIFDNVSWNPAVTDPNASQPSPYNGEIDVPVDANLGWTPGDGAVWHEVYFGTTTPPPYVPPDLPVGTEVYDPPGDLIASTTYYWQIVEVNGLDRYEGPIWDFATIPGQAILHSPADGGVTPGDIAVDNIYTMLRFRAGPTAVTPHPVYFSEDPGEVVNRVSGAKQYDAFYYDGYEPDPWYVFVGYPDSLYAKYTDSLVRGTTYYWAVDEKDAMGNPFPGDLWSFTIQDYYAFRPSPPNEAIFVSPDVLLTWLPGFGPPPGWPAATALEHDVYIGTDWDDVNNAVYNPGIPPPEFMDTVTDSNYQCSGLAPEARLYWRIDEVWGRQPPPIGGGHYYKGNVWCFTTGIANPGLAGEYYHHSDGNSPAGFESKVLVRIDPQIDFDFDADPPPGVRSDDFSVRWTGLLAVPSPDETYTFTTETDDGVRLWVNDELIIDDWEDQSPTFNNNSIALAGFGPFNIKMEYYENGGGAVARLYWQSPSTPYELIPSNYLSPTSEEAMKAFTAYGPYPIDGSLLLEWAPTFSWGPAMFAATHNLYLSTDFADVNERLVSPIGGLTEPNYPYPDRLDLDQTYYWAVDGVNTLHPDGPWEGDVWSFTIPPGGTGSILHEWWLGIGSGYPVSDLTSNPSYPDYPTGQELITTFEEPVNTWFNLGARIHGWLRPPVSGDYTFWIASDDMSELWLSTSEDPADANLIAEVLETAVPPFGYTGRYQWDKYPGQQSGPIALQGRKKYYIAGLMKHGAAVGNGHIEVAWQGPPGSPVPVQEIIDGQYLCAVPFDPPEAYGPYPPDGATGVDDRTPTLSWWPGCHVQAINGHKLYFSDNFEDVNGRNATPIVRTEPNYPYPAILELGRTYYWAVDEVNSVHPDTPWYGRVWSFTMAECMSLDNMEDYSDSNDIRGVWTDGYDAVVWMTQPPWTLLQGGSSGSNLNTSTEVGSYEAGGTGPIHGGAQAMVLHYDNDGDVYKVLFPDHEDEEQWIYDAPYFSEIEASTVGPDSLEVGLDWVSEGVKALTLWFQGHPISDGSRDFSGWPEFSVTARGRDIGGRHDEFYFFGMYPWIPSATITSRIQVQVVSLDRTGPWAAAGLMIREKWTPYSRYAAVLVTADNGIIFQWRDVEGGPTDSATETTRTAPQYLKLERTIAGAFTAYYSSDPSTETWADVNVPQNPDGEYWTVPMDEPSLYAGIAVTSYNAAELCTADFDDFSSFPETAEPWVNGDIGTNNAEQLYVALSDGATTAVVNHPDPCAATLTDWQEWNIELTEFTGVDMSNVEKVYIGLGDRDDPQPGGSGAIYIDDIRACPSRCVASLAKPLYDIAQPYDCIVKEEDLAVMAGDWLKSGMAVEDVWAGTWSNTDVGDVCTPGSFTDLGNDTFEISASGYDIWNTYDEFHYAYQPLSGDGQITVRVVNIAPDPLAFSGWAQAGVMIRETLDSNSIHVMMAITPDYINAVWRLVPGGESDGPYFDHMMTAPVCVRLIRKGDTFTAYYRYEDGEWIEQGEVTLPMTDPVYIGMVVSAHDDSGPLCTATFDRQCPATFLTTDLYPDFLINFKDYSLLTGSWLEEVLWP